MTLDSFLAVLAKHSDAGIHMMLPDGSFVPAHFHITEVGRVQKDFIDCGGTVRTAVSCVLQGWVAQDFNHRLETTKLLKILRLASPLLKATDLPVEVEYEDKAVSHYPVERVEVTPSGLLIHLGSKHTACLAEDRCGVGSGTASGCDAPGCCESEPSVLSIGAPV